MDRKSVICSVMSIIVIALLCAVVIGILVFPSYEAEKVMEEIGEEPDIIWKVRQQTENSSALLHLAVLFPGEYSSNYNFSAEVIEVEDSFTHSKIYPKGETRNGLFLFTPNGSTLESTLIVPDGEKLLVTVEIRFEYGRIANLALCEKRIEVTT